MLGGSESRAGSSAGKVVERNSEEAPEDEAEKCGRKNVLELPLDGSCSSARPARKAGMIMTAARMTRTSTNNVQPTRMRLTFIVPSYPSQSLPLLFYIRGVNYFRVKMTSPPGLLSLRALTSPFSMTNS